jgi:hypothetical protein
MAERLATATRPLRFTPEAELVLCCARTRLDETIARRIESLLAEPLDWSRVLDWARLHGVAPLLYRHLSRVGPGTVPAQPLRRLEAVWRANVSNGLRLSRELLKLSRLLESAAIPAIPFKGPSLAIAVYGELELRPSGDLDFLVEAGDAERLWTLLESHGFRMVMRERDWELHFESLDGSLIVDVHHRIAPSYLPSPGDFRALLTRAQRVRTWNDTLPTLGPEDLLLGLSLEFVRDCQHRRPRLKQLCDVTELLRAYPNLDWDTTLVRARDMGSLRLLLMELLAAHALLGASLPEKVHRAAAADRVASDLAADLPRRIFEAMPEQARSLDTRFYLRTRERVNDKLEYFRYLARGRLFRLGLLLKPSDQDRRFLPLPSALAFLHYLVRPVRVIWQRTAVKLASSSSRPPAGTARR